MNVAKLVSILCGAILFAGLAWSYGFLAGKGKVWPANVVDQAIELTESFVKFGAFLPENMRVEAPEGAARKRVAIHDADAAIGRGYYALLGWDDAVGNYSLWLHDAKGALVHRWNVDETSFYERAETNSNAPHAMKVMPDGDVIVGFDWLGVMARLTPCGEPVWLQEGFYHHAFTEAPDGNIWTWYGEGRENGHYQYMLKFDPETGETVRKIGLIEDVITRSPESAALFSLRTDSRFLPDDQNPPDTFHPNDVEELSPEMAAAFPMFEAGDLLMSIRNLNMVTVLDQEGRIKWIRQGPWLLQHDPDFRADGTISVYNNSRGEGRIRSDIVTVDPRTGRTQSLLGEWDVPFYSGFRGKQQELPNGNLLLTIPEQGQVLEVAPDGEVAVEFNNMSAPDSPFNDDLVNAVWLPEEYFDALPSCSQQS